MKPQKPSRGYLIEQTIVVDRKAPSLSKARNDSINASSVKVDIKGVRDSLEGAIDDMAPGMTIQIASNIYEEHLLIEKPSITLEPFEDGGEVTITQQTKPCIIIDIGKGNTCTINNLRMLLKGPNKDSDLESYQVTDDFVKKAGETAMKEFFAHKPDDLYCIILVRSGTLKMSGCTLSLDGVFKETHKKIPCVAAMPESTVNIFDCNFKGDTVNSADTAGLLSIDADVCVKNSTFAHFKSGGMMIMSMPQNVVYISNNDIISCETAGIYLQGRSSKPVVAKNKIRFCRCTAITTNLDVDSNIYANEMILNEQGIEILNNKSRCIDNMIDKAHDNGISIVGNDKSTKCTPNIWRNKIRACGSNGI